MRENFEPRGEPQQVTGLSEPVDRRPAVLRCERPKIVGVAKIIAGVLADDSIVVEQERDDLIGHEHVDILLRMSLPGKSKKWEPGTRAGRGAVLLSRLAVRL